MVHAPTFKAEFFEAHRRALRQLTGPGLIVVAGNSLVLRDSYGTYPFRQSSNFWYLTGINEPDITLVMDDAEEYLIVPEKTQQEIVFDGALDTDDLCRTSGIKEVVVGQTSLVGQRKVLDAVPHLARLRMIKSEPEIAAIQYAIDHTIRAFKLVGKNLTHYTNEQSIEADMTGYFIQNQLHHAYEPIIAGGLRATTLHYNKNNQPLDPRECVLLDVGAASPSYYCADITRTVAVRPSKRLQAVYAATLDVQLFAVNYLKPGVLLKDYEQAVNQLMGQKLQALGLTHDSEQTSIRQFYPHSTSHFLGLEVHDVGDYSAALQPGMVLTVEPGIYIKDEAIGVRIEDNVLITEAGNRVLSADLPKDVGSLTMSTR